MQKKEHIIINCAHTVAADEYHLSFDSSGSMSILKSLHEPLSAKQQQNTIYIHCIGQLEQQMPQVRQTEAVIEFLQELRTALDISGNNISGTHPLLTRMIERSTPLDEEQQAAQTRYTCEFQNIEIAPISPFLLRITGRVRNTSQLHWHSFIQPDYPIRVGLIISTMREGAQEVCFEDRCNLPEQQLQIGAVAPFTFEINPYLLPERNVQILISMVKERAFWFHQRGARPSLHEVSIDHPTLPTTTHRPLVVLPNAPSSLLFIAPSVPRFDQDSGGRRLFTLLSLLRQEGMEITYCYESEGHQGDHRRYHQALEALGITVVFGPLSYLSTCNTDAHTSVVLCWHECAARYIDSVRHHIPTAKIIIDTVDLHWVREERGIASGALSLSITEFAVRKDKELTTYRKADEIWLVTEDERKILQTEIPDCLTRLIPILSDNPSAPVELRTEHNLLFVGNFNHPPNIDAAKRAATITAALRARTGLDITLYLVGSNPPPDVRALATTPSIEVTGYVPDLTPYIASSSAFLAPLTYGAGIKGKILEAVDAGLPIYTTPIGNEGINLSHQEEGFIATTNDEFVSVLAQTLQDKQKLATVAVQAQQKIQRKTNKALHVPILRAAFQSPSVTIAIVTFNKRDLIVSCLQSIFTLTQHASFRVCVVSNGCTDGTIEALLALKEQYGSQLIINAYPHNRFFVVPNNQIIEQFPQDDIILLNNDVIITDPCWITELQHAVYESLDTGAAGPLILDQDGLVSEAGAAIFKDGSGRNFNRGINPAFIAHGISTVPFVSGCCLYMRRDMIQAFGALDTFFAPMYYEDAAWQYNLHRQGIRTVLNSRTSIIHAEGSTAGTSITTGMKRYQEINRKKFLSRFSEADILRANTVL